MPVAPVYAASKAGVVHATRSSGPGLAKQLGIRLMAACPEFVDTPLVRLMGGCHISNGIMHHVHVQGSHVGWQRGCDMITHA
jgi:NAD(P)-dependent dehydrogenase (short-subunit alcohol dehydrogenase family)